MVRCATLTNGSQQLFETGDFLFAYRGEATIIDQAILFNLQTLNYWLEEAHLVKNSTATRADGRKRRYGSDLIYKFPTNLEEFKKKISFVGIMLGANGVKQIRSRHISYGVGGLVKNVPNIFGPVEENTTLEFRVKKYREQVSGKGSLAMVPSRRRQHPRHVPTGQTICEQEPSPGNNHKFNVIPRE